MEERINEAFELGEALTVVGRQLHPGEPAPAFELDYFNPATSAMEQVRLTDSAGKIRLLNVVNSIDTPVCQIETHRWQSLSADLPANVILYSISMDLPFAQARWHQLEGVNHQSLSAHRSEQFGQAYGVLLKEWRLLQRAVFVIDQQDQIRYAEYVADQMLEPNYEATLKAVNSL
ncbi:thiol peroxidase [Spirosoma sp. HMF4905]|uniref:Thiol peroxidase n=1 Tax=Spirosoma arboris TaxID=2682092 RepID=A0A7K1SJV8_9BACT|nr:thiol peroxidase [Spirosoma arboris]MVM34090.1 thiol peroxidase [Spirosoma arboris]